MIIFKKAANERDRDRKRGRFELKIGVDRHHISQVEAVGLYRQMRRQGVHRIRRPRR